GAPLGPEVPLDADASVAPPVAPAVARQPRPRADRTTPHRAHRGLAQGHPAAPAGAPAADPAQGGVAGSARRGLHTDDAGAVAPASLVGQAARPVGGPAVAFDGVPRPAAQDAVLPAPRSLRVPGRAAAVIEFVEAVRAPLPDVAVHVV